MVNIQIFNFMDKPIRVVMKDNEFWFVAYEHGKVLNISGGSLKRRVVDMPADERMTCAEMQRDSARVLTDEIHPSAILVSESGLYRLIMRSKTPHARVFQDWVYKELLPALRKNGCYQMDRLQTPQNSLVGKNESKVRTEVPQLQNTDSFTDTESEFRLEHEMQMNISVRTKRAFMKVEATFFDGAGDSLVTRMRDAMQQLTDALQENISSPALPEK